MTTIQTVEAALNEFSTNYLEERFDLIKTDMESGEDMQIDLEELLGEIEYLKDQEAADNYTYQSHESIFGCPARI